MRDYATGQLRNIVLLGHGSAGKTMLAEAMLFASGAVNRMGRIEDGTTVADFDEEEINRQISLSLALVPVEWNDCKLNILDTPGYTDFIGEVNYDIIIRVTGFDRFLRGIFFIEHIHHQLKRGVFLATE